MVKGLAALAPEGPLPWHPQQCIHAPPRCCADYTIADITEVFQYPNLWPEKQGGKSKWTQADLSLAQRTVASYIDACAPSPKV